MKKKLKVIIKATICVLLLIIIYSTNCKPIIYPRPLIEIGESDNGGQVDIVLDQEFVVKLGSNESTGYAWEIERFDEDVIEQVGEVSYEHSFVPPPGFTGFGEITVFRFQGVDNGETELRLIYYTPWTEEEPIKTYSVQIVVR